MNLSILRNLSKLNSLNIQRNYLSSLSTHNRNAILTFPSLPPIESSKKLPKSGFPTTPILGQRGSTRHLQTSTAQPSVQPKKRRKMEKLTEAERAVKLQPLLDAGWTMVPGRDGIYKEYRFPDFIQAFSFMSGVAVVAEKIDHHPEWFNVYNKLNVTMFTHDCQGLSEKDIKLATFMDSHVKKFL